MVAKVSLPKRTKDYEPEPPAPRRGGPGRGYRFQPSDEQRRTVEVMRGLGASLELISSCVINEHTGRAIDRHTLAEAFADELALGLEKMKLKLSESLYQMATTGKNVTAAIWLEKSRGFYSERGVEYEGANRNVSVTIVLPDNHRDPAFAAKLMRQGSTGLVHLRSAGTLGSGTDQDGGDEE